MAVGVELACLARNPTAIPSGITTVGVIGIFMAAATSKGRATVAARKLFVAMKKIAAPRGSRLALSVPSIGISWHHTSIAYISSIVAIALEQEVVAVARGKGTGIGGGTSIRGGTDAIEVGKRAAVRRWSDVLRESRGAADVVVDFAARGVTVARRPKRAGGEVGVGARLEMRNVRPKMRESRLEVRDARLKMRNVRLIMGGAELELRDAKLKLRSAKLKLRKTVLKLREA